MECSLRGSEDETASTWWFTKLQLIYKCIECSIYTRNTKSALGKLASIVAVKDVTVVRLDSCD
jgi:hypothetical protein